ncbi:MAG: hypothetical protein R3D25_23105 [Geminicoccaceae bacterium]
MRPARAADLDRLVELEALFPGDRLSRRAMRHHLTSPNALLIVSAPAGRVQG